MKLITTCLTFLLLLIMVFDTKAQDYLDKQPVTYSGINFNIYVFSRAPGPTRLKAKYFAQNAYSRYLTWKQGKKVVLVCAGAFSSDWTSGAVPVGICVDNGVTVNNKIHSRDAYGNDLDGLVIVYGGGADEGGVVIKNIEKDCVKVAQGESACYAIQSNASDRYNFLQWAVNQSATVFQLPLMYSSTHGKSYGPIYYGSPKERRYLAICTDANGTVYHMVIDIEAKVYMNYCAQEIVAMLQASNFTVIGLMTLDTGGKNILYEYRNGRELKVGPTNMSEATNLLVYYVD